jgi:endonuclease/exonuclease/phosphatase family metal-dependent hydrolase
MRIVSWNCARGKHVVKLPPLLALRPSIAVLQETPLPTGPIADSQLWHGSNPHQGLAILAFDGWRLEQAADFRQEPQFFIAARAIGPKESFNILAVWTKPGSGNPPYGQALVQGLTIYERFIKKAPTVIIGDFNTGYVCDELESCWGLVSAYHYFHRADHGEERHPTLYFYRHRSRPFHFDYCFVPRHWRRRITDVRVGSYADWVGAKFSDHTPIIVDVRDRR